MEPPGEKSLTWSFIVTIIFLVVALTALAPALALSLVLLPVAFVVRRCMACCCCCSDTRVCALCCSRSVMTSSYFRFWTSPLPVDENTALLRQKLQCSQNRLSLIVFGYCGVYKFDTDGGASTCFRPPNIISGCCQPDFRQTFL